MKKSSIGIVILFLLMLSLVSAQTSFVYNETDRISLQIYASDPDEEDRDNLRTSYSRPLDRGGEWQTTYGDAGVYTVQVRVSDGDLVDEENVTVIVQRKEEQPELLRSLPNRHNVTLDEGRILTFRVDAQDKNQDKLTYVWSLEGEKVGEGPNIRFAPQYGAAGEYLLSVEISDGKSTIRQEWQITVQDVDLQSEIMDRIGNLVIQETDIARLPLPDYRYYGLDITLSEPLGNDNYWKTGYESAGTYPINVTVEGRGFSEAKRVFLVVENVDRPPSFPATTPLTVAEGETLTFSPKAQDPDNDTIIYSLKDIPPRATYQDNVLTWTPGFDAVQNTNLFADLARRFHLLSNTYTFTAIAQSRNLTVSQEIPVVVFNTNRPPTLDSIADITVREGERLNISPSASDPDNDPVSFSYSGWISDGDLVGYDESGTHYLTVTATDGFQEDSESIRVDVLNVNRPPHLSPVKTQRIKENRTLSVDLEASDPDNDRPLLSLVDHTGDARIEDGTLYWTPPYTTVMEAEETTVPLTVRASDGTDHADTNISVIVEQVNLPPVITETFNEKTVIPLGEPHVFWARASDPDGDNLTYTWRFGFFDRFEDQAHQRTFTKSGQKSVRLTVSDGKAKTVREFSVTVR